MRTYRSLCVLAVAALAVCLAAGARAEEGKAKASQLDALKRLAGDWSCKMRHGDAEHDATVSYKVTSGGSAVQETISGGTEHEMVTMYCQDGNDVVLTHYCMLGNQPQMKAPATGDGNKVEFKFVRATNLKSDKDMHMHDVTFTFVDKDTLRTEWTHFKDGKAAGQVVSELKRKK